MKQKQKNKTNKRIYERIYGNSRRTQKVKNLKCSKIFPVVHVTEFKKMASVIDK